MPASNFAPNPNLKPEIVKTIDLVWQQTIGNSNLILTRSKSQISDEVKLVAIDLVIQDGVTVFQPQNIGTVDLNNWELEFNSSITDRVFLRAGYTHHIDYVKVGVSENLIFMALNYNSDNWNVNINGYYHDKVLSRQDNGITFMDEIYLDEYWRFNFTANYKISEQLRVVFRTENLFDEEYKSFTSTDGGIENGLPNRGRLLSIGASWTF